VGIVGDSKRVNIFRFGGEITMIAKTQHLGKRV
jgi:hypothetical protein